MALEAKAPTDWTRAEKQGANYYSRVSVLTSNLLLYLSSEMAHWSQGGSRLASDGTGPLPVGPLAIFAVNGCKMRGTLPYPRHLHLHFCHLIKDQNPSDKEQQFNLWPATRLGEKPLHNPSAQIQAC
ncbi:hypothetical protein J1614_000608 [Plenodomus biglobosus]|nr:hypothetical protein J1614_000608 [Plenodomus biglobosus]